MSAKLPPRTEAQLEALVHQDFPDLHWSTRQLITEGWDHEVLILDNRYVFRFPNDDYYRSHLQHEIRLLKLLQPLVNINIPSYQFIAPNIEFAGYPLIPGRNLTKEVFSKLASNEKPTIAKQLADFLSVLHTLITNGHDLSFVPGWDFAEEYLESKQLAAKHLPSVLSPEDYEIVNKMLANIDTLLPQHQPKVFLHGDIYSRHLFWDTDKQQLGLIDFGDMTLGDPAYDFGELFEYGEDFVKQVYKAYQGPKDDTFLDRAWKYQQWAAVNMLTDHFVVGKTSFQEARQTFDRVKNLNFS